ncbi:WAT1-related protein At1g70260-like isoform X1 [Neltuma alba]|uniref:WAT1-related protein At1g70260-like isoform X1 n=1 Tax=Neltuma alba TaxID=207710 RepID=UPI0010A5872A|nr:WAT1-related protein At1g70260-like isoform X1 [Prosopis alba]
MEAKTQTWEVMPFIVMVIMEGCTIGLTIFAKSALTNGMSPFVFIVYTNSLATLILFLFSYLIHSNDRSVLPPFSFSMFMRFLFLGITGITLSQTFSFLGLGYSSPILVCAMGLLIPSFNFLLSLFLRKKNLNFRSSATLFQVMGTLISIMGAALAEFFKGPLIRPSSHQLRHAQHFFIFSSTPEFWVLGGLLLAAASFSVSLWNFMQKGTVKLYPEPMKVICYYNFLGTISSAIVSIMVERDSDAWKLKHKMELILVVLTALFGGVIRPTIQVWFTRLKGPFYFQIFKPFGIAYATIFGVTFFPNSLHFGSVVGTTITGIGYYSVMWGQIKEDEDKIGCDESSDSLDKKAPLLKENKEMQV